MTILVRTLKVRLHFPFKRRDETFLLLLFGETEFSLKKGTCFVMWGNVFSLLRKIGVYKLIQVPYEELVLPCVARMSTISSKYTNF